MQTKFYRHAFTMIELIFAIVIIAITVVSLPMMSQVIGKGTKGNLQQEAIFAASTELMGALSGYWDERSMEDANASSLARVIDIDGDCNATTRLRVGHIAQPYHRRCLDSNTSGGLSTIDGSYYSLDDAAHGFKNTYTSTVGSAEGYKNAAYQTKITVTRSGNTKVVTATVKDANDNTIITVLRAQSANIGETDNYYRTF